jgi:hypothetical protein
MLNSIYGYLGRKTDQYKTEVVSIQKGTGFKKGKMQKMRGGQDKIPPGVKKNSLYGGRAILKRVLDMRISNYII